MDIDVRGKREAIGFRNDGRREPVVTVQTTTLFRDVQAGVPFDRAGNAPTRFMIC
jgi:hypothetical protein